MSQPAMKAVESEAVAVQRSVYIVGWRVYCRCRHCDKLVQVNKPLLGSLHICAP